MFYVPRFPLCITSEDLPRDRAKSALLRLAGLCRFRSSMFVVERGVVCCVSRFPLY